MKPLIKALKIFIALSLVFIGVYAFINWQSLSALLFGHGASTAAEQKKTEIASQVEGLTTKLNKNGGTKQILGSIVNIRAEASSQFANDWLYYPELGIEAPVEWQVNQADIERMMPDSLINVAGSALPAENGDMLIAGHSSYYSWSKGKYKNIFAGLVKAKEGDSIVIRRKDLTNFYKVSEIKQIGGNDNLDLHIGGTYSKNLYLMTCVPVGTSWRRLIIRAEFVRSI